MDTLVLKDGDKQQIWYSEEYLKHQIEEAFRAGLFKGVRVQFHAVTPMNSDAVNNLVDEFNRRIKEEYEKAFNSGQVWQS